MKQQLYEGKTRFSLKRWALLLTAIIALGDLTMHAESILDYETDEFFDGDPFDSSFWPSYISSPTENGRVDEYYIRYAAVIDSPWYENCVRWLIPGMVYSDWEGKPEVPVDGYSLNLPEGYKCVNITLSEAEYKEYDFELQPSIPPVPETEPQRFIDIEPYEGFFPTEPICDNGVVIYRGTYIAFIGIRPVAYDYQNQIVRAYTHVKYTIEYSKGDTGVQNMTGEDNVAPQYYSLQGLRINKPQKGNVYIERRGSQCKKIIY